MEDDGLLDDKEMELFTEFLSSDLNNRTFELRSTEAGFGPEDIEKVFAEIRMFVSARIMKEWDTTGDSPKEVRINLSLDIT